MADSTTALVVNFLTDQHERSRAEATNRAVQVGGIVCLDVIGAAVHCLGLMSTGLKNAPSLGLLYRSSTRHIKCRRSAVLPTKKRCRGM